jgi:hypothetical protein
MFESKLNKGRANGYVPLDQNLKISSTYVNDTHVTGGTYNNGVISFTDNFNSSFDVTGLNSFDITGGTYNNGVITLNKLSGDTLNVTGLNNTNISDNFIPVSNGSVLIDSILEQFNGNELHISGNTTVYGDLNITGNINIKPYKVYTALLTQGGGNNTFSISSGALTQGVTYYFGAVAESEWDFSNVGGPIYPNYISFVATSSSVPTNYASQSLMYNIGAPVVTVLENTIGNVWFTYDDTGKYIINSTELFTINKTYTSISNVTNYIDNPYISDLVFINNNTIQIGTYNPNFDRTDDFLYNTPIEIRVYN